MKTIEIKAGELMKYEQALLIAEGDEFRATELMEDHNADAYRLIKLADTFEREHHFCSPYKAMEKICSYEYNYTKQDLEEMGLMNSFSKAIRGTQAYSHAPYYFSEEDVEWDDIPF